MKIAIASDHGGFRLKEVLKVYLRSKGHKITDFGTYNEESCDYPDYARKVAEAVASGRFQRGILVCKSGIGMAISANKIKGIRAADIRDVESAVLSRQHNDTNVVTLGSRFVKPALAKKIVDVWLKTRPLGGRHRRRVNQIKKMELS